MDLLSVDDVDDVVVVACNFDCKIESIGDVGINVGVNDGFVETTDGLALPVFGYTKCNGTDCGLSGIFTKFCLVYFHHVQLINFINVLALCTTLPKGCDSDCDSGCSAK